MMGIAAGLTIGGKIPYATFANFSAGRGVRPDCCRKANSQKAGLKFEEPTKQ